MVEIAQLGIIGNCRSAALISKEGSIVWACMPDFDSPSIFARILDEEAGGEFCFVPDEGTAVSQSYVDRTNILRTLFEGHSGSFEVLDFMPLYHIDEQSYYNAPEIYRLIHILHGNPVIKVRYQPKLNYNQNPTQSFIYNETIKSNTVKGEYHSVYLYSSLPLEDIMNERPITLTQNVFFLVSYHQKLISIDLERVELEFERTKVYWMNWVNRTAVYPLYQKEIIRSALALKLLTYQKTGAVIAAVTTSLPESIGENRNWDYRYCWLRDASMIIQTLTKIHHRNTARDFLRFLLNTLIDKAETLQILYSVRGEKELTERKLPHLKGYKNSHPVRVGNAAYVQKQNDIYGVLMDLIYLCFCQFPGHLNEAEELWTTVRFIMKTVEDNWYKPDRSIWEIRKEHKHFVFSKVLSWMAADRGVMIAEMFNREDYITPWSELRDSIRRDIELKGWNPEKQAFTQTYDSAELDASVLLMEKVGFCNASDPRYISTVRTIYQELSRNGLMYRYKNRDDFGKPQSAFIICTFWMIESLYKIGEKGTAVKLFDDLLKSANHLGLFSEDMDFETHELLGNFPQGYSHLELINTAILLNGDGEEKSPFRPIQP
jgi:GH15 family glucan-1,4-alpha-glucosidase